MSHKQDNQGNYMDGVKVKISEKYKPPPKINLAMTYAQRLTLNKQLQDNMPTYDFALEKSVVERMKELRVARKMMALERRGKLDKITEDRKRQAEEVLQEQELKTEEAIEATTSGGLLIPTQVNANNYTNILMPIPLTSRVEVKPKDKSPINISDFEPDTCSPFDNVELNTINDMEELKLVLQNDGKRTNLIQPTYQAQLTYPCPEPQINYYGYNAAHSSNQIYPTYTGGNGYNYCLSETLHPKINSYAVYDYNSSKEYSSSFDAQTPQVNVDLNKEPFRSVPDIMKALQTELNNTHINNKDNSSLPSHSMKAVHSNLSSEDSLDNPFEHLPKKTQDICKVISTMGFPLSRVARACKDIGDDEKRVVEHLLAMSELLDLGFSEKQVSTALLECNHDRDKALESLIS